ncbi:ATP-binding protein [Cognatiyoonia sp. IB215182]|uniref:hybrid sensor histidine kinase/response regulator n=1 Tax=Cognatiyoonia sp. IB215182 TaxID=3097353 RepID=UPI002A0BD9A3|nr:ATP-binding protein [Cognatiyoonia sp. IB215182]MDX8355313.1 ATP-binding protein [Cognatiyoonia sp. IB215182]
MKAGMNRYRIAVLAGLGLICLLLSFMVTNLLAQLRELSTAASDNTQWSISQLDTELANLSAVLADGLSDPRFSPDDIQLRIDIMISRARIINSGSAAAIFSQDDRAASLIAPINDFVDRAIAISDQPGSLNRTDLEELRRLVQDVRPNIRETALLGVTLGAANAEARRAEFARQLRRTGSMVIGLLLMMGGLLLLLERMLQRAARRDADLQTSSQLLASTVAASLDAIVTADETGKIVEFNAAAEDVFGWERAEIVGQNMERTFIPERMRDAHHNGMKRYLETGKPRVVGKGRVELAALRKTGEEFPVELNITSIKDGKGTKFIAYVRDISERKINEQKLIDARDRAERTDKAKSQFLAVMSHEMRTPLNGIMGVLDLLRTTRLSPKQDHYTKIASASSEILLEHVNEALDITRIETGTLQLTPQHFDLTELVRSVVDVLEPLAAEKRLSLALDLEDSIQMGFWGDSNRIRQILINLIGNAIKFTESGTVTLKVTGIHGASTSSLKFAVTDTGAGIPVEDHERVFEDFVALAHGSGRHSRGDGLGLSISRKIARQLGGDIVLESEIGNGSTFTLNLPLERSTQLERQSKQHHAATPASPCSVLIVEDNDINRRVLEDMLVGLGHEVDVAVNGAESLDKLAVKPFDIVFMDISMPVMDGIEATRQLRGKDGPNRRTHIVGLTAHGREEYREEAEQAGMDRFHTKPIRLDALQGIIADVADRAHLPMTAIQNDVLKELADALGPEKLRGICDRFLSELQVLASDLRDGTLVDDPTATAEAAHKAKGAAAMFGLTDLEDLLLRLEKQARAEGRIDVDRYITQILHGAESAKATIADALKNV